MLKEIDLAWGQFFTSTQLCWADSCALFGERRGSGDGDALDDAQSLRAAGISSGVSLAIEHSKKMAYDGAGSVGGASALAVVRVISPTLDEQKVLKFTMVDGNDQHPNPKPGEPRGSIGIRRPGPAISISFDPDETIASLKERMCAAAASQCDAAYESNYRRLRLTNSFGEVGVCVPVNHVTGRCAKGAAPV